MWGGTVDTNVVPCAFLVEQICRPNLHNILKHYFSRPHRNTEVQQTMKEYPQVRKTGVDAVHESCPQKVYIMKNCNL